MIGNGNLNVHGYIDEVVIPERTETVHIPTPDYVLVSAGQMSCTERASKPT